VFLTEKYMGPSFFNLQFHVLDALSAFLQGDVANSIAYLCADTW